jgi:hypothetical protein
MMAALGLGLAPTMVEAAGNAPQPTICQRACWGARAPKSTTLNSTLTHAIIHHTAGPNDFNTNSQSDSAALVRAIQNYHLDVNGWSDIGYHFLVDKLGNRFEGRSGSMNSLVRGSHDGINVGSFGFNMLGYMHAPYNHAPTTAQRNALYDLIAWRMPNGFTGYGSGSYNGTTRRFVSGHRDVGSTVCPGDLAYPYIGTDPNGGEARNAINQRIVGTAPGIIIDNTSAQFTITGSWGTSTSAGFYGTDSLWASGGGTADTGRWTPNLTQSGVYEVYAWWVAGTNRATNAVYQINERGTIRNIPANQSANGGQWNLLGSFQFDAGTGGWIQLSDSGVASDKVVSADAVRLVRTGPLPTPTASPSPTASATPTASPSPTASASPTPSISPSATPSPTATATPTPTPTASPSPSPSPSPIPNIIVDNTDPGFSVSSTAWFTGTSVAGYYGSNYHARSTQAVSDPARWTVTLPTTGSYKVYARWTAASNRATAAPYQIIHSGGTTTVNVNQQTNNGVWVLLGTYNFAAGTAERVRLSCWTTAGFYVIADAVMFEAQ